MKNEYHFWYSEGQRKALKKYGMNRLNCAVIRGEEVEYTECNEQKEPMGLWEDYRYLGEGTIYRLGGKNV